MYWVKATMSSPPHVYVEAVKAENVLQAMAEAFIYMEQEGLDPDGCVSVSTVLRPPRSRPRIVISRRRFEGARP